MKDESLLEEIGENLLEETGDNLLEENSNTAESEDATRQKQLVEQLRKELMAAKKQREKMERRTQKLEAERRVTQSSSSSSKPMKIVWLLVALACGFGVYYLVDWIGKEMKEKEMTEMIEAQKRSLKDAGIYVDDFSFDEKASKNGQRGIEITMTLKCKKLCNKPAKIVLMFCDENKTPYPATKKSFSYDGKCALVFNDKISSKKHVVKKFMSFDNLPEFHVEDGFWGKVARFVDFQNFEYSCNVLILDKNNTCVHSSEHEMEFGVDGVNDLCPSSSSSSSSPSVSNLKDADIGVDDFSFNENASKNGQRGIEITLTLNCKCNTIAKTVITICNEKKTPYPAKNEDFSYEGNCAIVSLDSISSEKYILKKFVPFRSLPKVQCVKGVLFKEYGFWCDISIMDKNNVCVYTSSEELLFEKPADYDKLYASVSVDKVWVDHNIYQDGAKGMLIHVKFDVANALGENCKCVAYFYKVDGSKLKDTNNRFCTVDGQVSTSEDFSSPYESSYWKDFSFFMPYSELHVNSKNDLYFELVFFIYHSDGKYEEIGRYSKVTFTYDV